MKVLIFGHSFDSLLACHAASMAGHDVKLYVESNPALIFESGPNLLLQPIPLVEMRGARLNFSDGNGDPDVFMDKLVNQGGAGRGPEGYDTELIDGMPIYDGRNVYEQLIELYMPYAQELGALGGREAIRLIQDFQPDETFSGIDRDELCVNNEHNFQAAAVVTMVSPNQSDEKPFLTFNGERGIAWAMEYKIFGPTYRAYGAGKQPPVSGDKLGGYIIPQGHNCDCNPLLDYVGLLGAWDHKWRRHKSFYAPFAKLGLA